MNKSLVIHFVSKSMLIGSALFAFPALVSLIYKEYSTALAFISTGVITAIIFFFLSRLKPKQTKMFAREGMAIAALIWVCFSLVGAIPFMLTHTVTNFFDALFESTSGFTTTGASIMTEVESLPKGILFWRNFSNWVGGMGVLVFAIAILPSSADSLYLMQAECPGPQVSKLVPKGKNSAAYLYTIYTAMTVILFILLVIGKMPVFDSLCHAMGTAGTGGFSVRNSGIGAYNSTYIEIVITIAMFLFGVNFNLYYLMLIRRFGEIRKNTELKVYISLVVISIILITINIFPIYGNVFSAIRYSAFQVSSLSTSTGFSTADYDKWPLFSQCLLLVLMFIGASSGSTAGGFKIQRFVILGKSASLSVRRMLHPNSVNVVKVDDKIIDSDSVHMVMRYLSIYIALIMISLMVFSISDTDFTTAFSAVLTAISNNGGALSEVGPTSNFAGLSNLSKLVMIVDMLFGRLECLPMLVLFAPSAWRKVF